MLDHCDCPLLVQKVSQGSLLLAPSLGRSTIGKPETEEIKGDVRINDHEKSQQQFSKVPGLKKEYQKSPCRGSAKQDLDGI